MIPRSGILLLWALAGIASYGVAADSSAVLEKEINDFFGDPEFFDFRISTDGTCVSYGEYRGRSRRSLMTISFTEGETRGLEAAPGDDIFSQGWIGPELLVYERASLERTRLGGVYSCRVLIHDVLRLDEALREGDPVWPRVVHTMPRDPTTCAVIDPWEPGSFPDLRYLNVVDGRYVGRVKNPGRTDRWWLDTKGQARVVRNRAEEKGTTVYLYRDDNDGEWRPLKLEREIGDWRFFDDGYVAFAEVLDGPRVYVQAYDFSKGSFLGDPIESDTVDVTVDGFIHDPSTFGIYGMRIEEGRPRIVWFDKGVAQLEQQLSEYFPDTLITFLGINNVSKDLFFRVESDINPGAYYAISAQGAVTQLGQVNSRLSGYDLPRTEVVEIKNREGQVLHGYYTPPIGAKGDSPPLLVIPHGGPHSKDEWGYSAARQFFAHKGFATLTVNYRGSSGYGRAFWEQDGFASILERSVDDVIDATRWAVEERGVDPRGIAIMGASFGGYIAVEAVTREPDLYRCSVGFAGVYDWPKQLLASRRDSRAAWDWYNSDQFGDHSQFQERYAALSPINHLEAVRVPILLMHGRADSRVEVSQSRALRNALRSLGKPCELGIESWGQHGFVDEGQRVRYYRKVYEFIQTHLRP